MDNSRNNDHPKDREDRARNQPLGGLICIVAFGLFLFIGVVYLSRAFPERTGQYTFVTQSFLNIFILVAIAIQAWIYLRQ